MMMKSDINLLPAKKHVSAYVAIGIPFGIILSILLLIAGIYFPSVVLGGKQESLDKLKAELLGYEDVNTQYIQKLQELQDLQSNKKNLEDFFSGKGDVLEISNMLSEIIPDDVTIVQFDFTEAGIVISGIARNDLIIADLEDTFWKTGRFSEINLGTISGMEEERSFVFTLTYFQDSLNGGENQ